MQRALGGIDDIAISPIEEAIGGYIAELVEDGSCLQLGWGGIPNSVCKALLHKKDLGIHTELLSDGMVDLILAGAVNNSRKQTHLARRWQPLPWERDVSMSS